MDGLHTFILIWSILGILSLGMYIYLEHGYKIKLKLKALIAILKLKKILLIDNIKKFKNRKERDNLIYLERRL
jgi:hypothetical protein